MESQHLPEPQQRLCLHNARVPFRTGLMREPDQAALTEPGTCAFTLSQCNTVFLFFVVFVFPKHKSDEETHGFPRMHTKHFQLRDSLLELVLIHSVCLHVLPPLFQKMGVHVSNNVKPAKLQ